MRRDRFDQARQFRLLVPAGDLHPFQRRLREIVLGVAEQVDLGRRGIRQFRQRRHRAGALVIRQDPKHGDAQLAFARRNRVNRPCGPSNRLVRHHDGAVRQAVAADACQHVLAGAEDPLGFLELPGALGPPRQDIPRPMRRPIGDAGIAGVRGGLVAVEACRQRQQVHLRTDRKVVVHRQVERHIQPVDQAANVDVHAQQVMDMDALHAELAQHLDQILQSFGRQGKLGMAGQHRDRQLAAAGAGFQQQDVGLAVQALDQAVDMAPHATAKAVRDHQQHRQARVPQQRSGQGEAERPDRIQPDVPGDVRVTAQPTPPHASD
jgi:hypothetical protein